MKNSKTKSEQPRELYLKIPYHILNIPGLGLSEKVLLAHFYSFGKKGCWQSNATLAEMFGTSSWTISRWIKSIKKYIQIKCPKGYYRTIWVKSHPEVVSGNIEYRKTNLGKNAEDPMQNYQSDCGNSANRLMQKCATTNNNTIKETINNTTAQPLPLPAGGQAPALLEERKRQLAEDVAKFKARFGSNKQSYRRTPGEIEEMKRQAIAQVNAMLELKKQKAAEMVPA